MGQCEAGVVPSVPVLSEQRDTGPDSPTRGLWSSQVLTHSHRPALAALVLWLRVSSVFCLATPAHWDPLLWYTRHWRYRISGAFLHSKSYISEVIKVWSSEKTLQISHWSWTEQLLRINLHLSSSSYFLWAILVSQSEVLMQGSLRCWWYISYTQCCLHCLQIHQFIFDKCVCLQTLPSGEDLILCSNNKH